MRSGVPESATGFAAFVVIDATRWNAVGSIPQKGDHQWARLQSVLDAGIAAPRSSAG